MKTGLRAKPKDTLPERAKSDSVVFLRWSGSERGRHRWTQWPRCRMPSDGQLLTPADRLTIRMLGRNLGEVSTGQGNGLEERRRP